MCSINNYWSSAQSLYYGMGTTAESSVVTYLSVVCVVMRKRERLQLDCQQCVYEIPVTNTVGNLLLGNYYAEGIRGKGERKT